MFNNFSKDQRQQAENLWKMLDDMSQNDPEQYKKFVQQNINEGFKEMAQEQKNQNSVKPKYQHTIKLYANLTVIHPKYDKRVKFYFNIFTNDNIIEESLSMSKPTQSKSKQFNFAVYFYEVVINPNQLKNQTKYVSLIKDRIKYDRNPLQSNQELPIFYEFNLKSLEKLEKYKAPKKDTPIPQELLIEQQANKNKAQPTKLQNIQFKEEDSQVEENIQSVIKVPDQEQQEKPKKILIEEIKSEIIIQKPEWNIQSEWDKVVITIELPEVDKFKDIEMELSEESIKLEVKDVYSLNEKLGMKVDNQHPKARWDKKNKKLILTVNKV